MNVLVAGGSQEDRSYIHNVLSRAHFCVTPVENGAEAVSHAEINEYDLVILDLFLPDKNGMDICSILRSREVEAPIIIVTSQNNMPTRVSALDSGADDFLLRPVCEEELLARIRALLRRERTYTKDVIIIKNVVVDATRYVAECYGEEIPLTSMEYRILYFLMRKPNRLCTKSMLEEHVWGRFHLRNSNVVEVTMSRIRRKLRRLGQDNFITTRRGMGYVIKDS